MICEQNHQARQESTGKEKTAKKLFWHEKGFCLRFYLRFLMGGGGGDVR